MESSRPDATTATADLIEGQRVVVFTRWLLVVSALVVALWNPGPIGELRVQVVAIILLAGANFYLHAQLLVKRPSVRPWVVYGTSAGDLAVIAAIVVSQGGFASNNYIFLYPAVLALAVAFPRRASLGYTAIAAAGYGIAAAAAASEDPAALSIGFTRMLVIAAVGVCGAVYRDIEHQRRNAGTASPEPEGG